MEDLTTRICWELVKKEGYITIWRKPLNNSCYLNRDAKVLPPLYDRDDNPDNVWYAFLQYTYIHQIYIITLEKKIQE